MGHGNGLYDQKAKDTLFRNRQQCLIPGQYSWDYRHEQIEQSVANLLLHLLCQTIFDKVQPMLFGFSPLFCF